MSDFRIDQITNQAGTAGPDIAGITTFSGSSGLLMPSGDTFRRSALDDVVQDGLVLYLDAGNDVSYPGSGNKWFDLSNNGNTGTLVNGVGYSASNGGALSFDGSDDYVSLGTKNIITTDFSVNMWVKVTAATKEVFFFSFGYNDSSSALMFKHPDINILYIIYSNSGTTTQYASSFEITQNVLYNITWTRNGSNNILYINGFDIYSFSNSTILSSCIYDIGWASSRNKTTAYYQGNIYTTSLYNRALTAAEVSQNYNALKGRYT